MNTIKRLKASVGKKTAAASKTEAEKPKLLAEIDQLNAIIERYRSEMHELLKKIKDYKDRDNYHDGPGTPPSKCSLTRQEARRLRAENRKSSDKKQGAQKGHEGKGRKVKIDETKEHTLDKCPKCDSENIHETGKDTRIVTDIPKPAPPKTICHHIHKYRCNSCGHRCTPETGLPKRGNFGINTILAILSHHLNRLSVRMIYQIMAREGIRLAIGTVQSVIRMISNAMAVPAAEIMEKIAKSARLNADETSIRFNNENWWLWVFLNETTGDTFYTIQKSRGRDVIRYVLGDQPKQTLVCDGWQPYAICEIQRCWAHILNESKTLALKNKDVASAQNVKKRLDAIYHDLKKARRYKRLSKRHHLRENLNARLRRLVDQYINDDTMKQFMKKLESARLDLLRCVIDLSLSPTNNSAERALREPKIQMRIRGCIRSAKSIKGIGDLLTCHTTWKNHGLDHMAEFAKYL